MICFTFFSNLFKENQKLSKNHIFQYLNRSSRPEVFWKKGVVRNFAKFTGKHLCQSLFLNKVAGLLKKRLWHRYFPVNFVKFARTPFLTKHLGWLLLDVSYAYYIFILRTLKIQRSISNS